MKQEITEWRCYEMGVYRLKRKADLNYRRGRHGTVLRTVRPTWQA